MEFIPPHFITTIKMLCLRKWTELFLYFPLYCRSQARLYTYMIDVHTSFALDELNTAQRMV